MDVQSNVGKLIIAIRQLAHSANLLQSSSYWLCGSYIRNTITVLSEVVTEIEEKKGETYGANKTEQ